MTVTNPGPPLVTTNPNSTITGNNKKSGCGRNMGFDFGLNESTFYKRRNRWLLKIDDVSASGVNTLAPLKSSRPTLSFKEIEVPHLTENIFFPGRPEWKPISLTLYDVKQNINPVFEWLAQIYDPRSDSKYSPSCDGFKKSQARLELYDGCGNTLETWVFESIWPNLVDFGELDMTNCEVITCDLTLRYDRAYIEN